MLAAVGASMAFAPNTAMPTVTAHGMGDSCFNSGAHTTPSPYASPVLQLVAALLMRQSLVVTTVWHRAISRGPA